MMESTASLKVARRSPENMCRLVTDNSASICCMQDQDSTGRGGSRKNKRGGLARKGRSLAGGEFFARFDL